MNNRRTLIVVWISVLVFSWLMFITQISEAQEVTLTQKHKCFYMNGKMLYIGRVLGTDNMIGKNIKEVSINYNMIRSEFEVDWLYNGEVIGHTTLPKGMHKEVSFTYNRSLPGTVELRFTGTSGQVQVASITAVVTVAQPMDVYKTQILSYLTTPLPKQAEIASRYVTQDSYLPEKIEPIAINPKHTARLLHDFVAPQRVFLSHLVPRHPPESQGRRRTCMAFAVAALLESQLLKEKGTAINLSEQWLHFIQKTAFFDEKPLPYAENQFGRSGGSKLEWSLITASLYGLPTENIWPYINRVNYEDVPWQNAKALAVDRDNLQWGLRPKALIAPKYRVKKDKYVFTNRMPDRATLQLWLETILASGRPVAIGLNISPYIDQNGVILPIAPGGNHEQFLIDDPTLRDNLIGNNSASSIKVNCPPGGKVTLYSEENYLGRKSSFTNDDCDLGDDNVGNDSVSSIKMDRRCRTTLYECVNYNRTYGGHGVVLYGYDRNRQYFIAKNSWGIRPNPIGDDLGGLWALHYDFLDRICEYGYVTSLITPQKAVTLDRAMLYLGWWMLSLDNWKGTLAINRIPTNGIKRIGNLYSRDFRQAYRVNGRLNTDGSILICVDFKNPQINGKTDSCNRYRFDLRIAGADAKFMMGYYYDPEDKRSYGAYASRTGKFLRGIHPSFDATGMKGTWEMNHDSWKGTLIIETTTRDGSFQGYYIGQEGKQKRVLGCYNWDGSKKQSGAVFFTVQLDENPQPFLGYHHSGERNVIAGQTTWKGRQFGFYLNKVK